MILKKLYEKLILFFKLVQIKLFKSAKDNLQLGINEKANIKLIIWDLDDTFWKGTLSEGDIQLIDENIYIIKALLDRGIMNSICSKNDFECVRKILANSNGGGGI
jgi:predicted enzyme involved in methoxymalonyl-ACP biosynthesis